mmetsp:Transcript_20038/g.60703  ORF Transcript_20038/g.60703 Transcript_20038/m.60703 type:complete len:88 (+) Transcript_20038:677-940(+)
MNNPGSNPNPDPDPNPNPNPKAAAGALLFSGGEDGCLKEWALTLTPDCGEPLKSHYGHTKGLTAAVTAESGKLVTASWDGTVRDWSR